MSATEAIRARAIIHVDMDAFYASVEQRDDPRLRGLPVIVGGHRQRGVVLAASYEVRPLGVRSAMSMARAVQLAPQAIVVAPRGHAYAEASERVFEIFETYTPAIEPLSLDEAFLDVTESLGLFGSPTKIAREIRDRIAREVSLPASAGIASVKFVAKMASDHAKPNGQFEVPLGTEQAFLAPLPVSRLWGVGPKTEDRLVSLGLRTIGDIAGKDPAWLEARLGESGLHFHQLAHGIDERTVVSDRAAQSIGAEDTFEENLRDPERLAAHVHSQVLRVARRMRKAGLRARVVVLKLKSADFKLRSRRLTLDEASDDPKVIFEAARLLLERELPLTKALRLTGISAHDLIDGSGQLPLFVGSAHDKAKRLNATLDRIADRFGRTAVLPAHVAQIEEEDDADEETRRQMGAARFDVRPPKK